jgi:nitrous oxidase accessory protein NosD
MKKIICILFVLFLVNGIFISLANNTEWLRNETNYQESRIIKGNDQKGIISGKRGNIIVDASGGQDHVTIQDAINASNPGDTIYVYAGNYSENVIINRTITLIGNGTANTTINGSGNGDVVQITSAWVNIMGFNITNSGSSGNDAGIDVQNDYNRMAQTFFLVI